MATSAVRSPPSSADSHTPGKKDFASLDNLQAVLNSVVRSQAQANAPRPSASPVSSDTPSEILNLLENRGCYNYPPPRILKGLFESYFRFVHPGVPFLDESEIWSLWHGDIFTPGTFSPLVLRALMFSCSQFLTAEGLQAIGCSSKREARNAFYDQAKLLVDFDTSNDFVARSRACLLLSYHVPYANAARINSYWVMNAVRYARLAKADTFYLIKDPRRALVLKKLWWSIAFRDSVLSLGLRRTPNLKLTHALTVDASHILEVSDYVHAQSRSLVFNLAQQNRLYELVSVTCRFVQRLNPILYLMYEHEIVEARVENVRLNRDTILSDIDRASVDLWAWHRAAIQLFPRPISMDGDEGGSDSIVVAANTVFVVHATAHFQLHLLKMLLHELDIVPDNPAKHTVLEDASTIMEGAMEDIGSRFQELLQSRLSQCLAISMSAYVLLPLVLQEINVGASKGNEVQERVEARRQVVFQRVLSTQRSLFDGSDIAAEVFDNLSSTYAVNNDLSSLPNNRARGHNTSIMASYWPSLIRNRPRELLIVLLRLDRICCANGLPDEEDTLPAELLSGVK